MNCDRCKREFEELNEVSLHDEHALCDPCLRSMSRKVYRHDIDERYTQEQHERAVSLLTELPEMQCVIDSFEDRRIIVHTPYVCSAAVTDFCKHFGYQIGAFHPVWEKEDRVPCVSEHGDTFQIVLEYVHYCPEPAPMETEFVKSRITSLKDSDKQF